MTDNKFGRFRVTASLLALNFLVIGRVDGAMLSHNTLGPWIFWTVEPRLPQVSTTVCTPTTTIHQHNNQDGGRQLTNRMGLNDSVGRRSLVSKPKSFIFISIFVLSTLTDDEHHHNLWDGGCHKISSNKAFSFFPFPFSFSVFFYVLATTIFSTTSTTTTTTTTTTHQHQQHFNQHPKPLNASKRRWQQQQ